MRFLKYAPIAGIFIAAGIAIAPGVAHANITGEKLLEACSSKKADALAACDGYLAGVADAINTAKAGNICFPAGATVKQFRDMALKELQAKPEIRHQTGSTIMTPIFASAFPCKKS